MLSQTVQLIQNFSIGKFLTLTIIFDVMVEIFSGDAGPDADVEVFRVVVRHVLHLGDVDADAAEQGRDSGFESRSSAVRNDRNVVGVAEFADLKQKLVYYYGGSIAQW